MNVNGGGAGEERVFPIRGTESGLDPKPVSNLLTPLLTDMYQITMCYGYWKANRHETRAVFDMFFRKSPFQGEYCIFAGLRQCLAFLKNWKMTEEHIRYLRKQMPLADEKFFDYLRSLDASCVELYAHDEGSVVFPREPLLRVEGPIAMCQLLETTLLCIVNYASLVATNASRMRTAVGPDKVLLEMGLRRAQGLDGALSASYFSHIGGFNATSNVLAGMMFGIKVSGTHAHAFVQSFTSLSDLGTDQIEVCGLEEKVNFVELVLKYRRKLGNERTNEGELAAFIAYCQAFPNAFLALVDTYDTLYSGLPNFLSCALAMIELGYKPLGIRLDSGCLSTLSIAVREVYKQVEEKFALPGLSKQFLIVASNDLDEDRLYALQEQGHSVDVFGIGTHLVTCSTQPALGGVYKLVEAGDKARIKLSQELVKVTVPGKKRIFRLFGQQGLALADVMQCEDEPPPEPHTRVLCRHILEPGKRAVCVPTHVEEVLRLWWNMGRVECRVPTVDEVRAYSMKELERHKPSLRIRKNPIPYKVSLSEKLFKEMHELWMAEAPIAELM
mmetsp:Transcript_31071/g.76229  ORF Transcript_31071/g.76229 Transcript_31071/m.76229 type:complete len:557 (+) Transcript_31071:165-1835(+)|eukprot:CAMPEP_0206234038 /NCGR_PEP_ID=MMETSP0047_2-20121206/12352_1 /ASSEMBLY_ACC=CAM_ASM_000192 /TAXON_ID=195065 /ORGANISM="Chroomonas mesostigmatica_cf, Strain CCMP1168" /LENGTH=556 /DNA_ID=CAMNT_0053658047 /DNA_START=20 /DNA_END=1690 /DNA_ORIENTATION=-